MHLDSEVKYTDEQIHDAVVRCIDSWDMDILVTYATHMLYREYKHEDCPAHCVNELVREFSDGQG